MEQCAIAHAVDIPNCNCWQVIPLNQFLLYNTVYIAQRVASGRYFSQVRTAIYIKVIRKYELLYSRQIGDQMKG